MKKTVYLYLDETYIGELLIASVRGHETWMFRYDSGCLDETRPLIDPAIANVRGPQFPTQDGCFGFLADVAPDRWGRKLIRRREKRVLTESDFLLGVCDRITVNRRVNHNIGAVAECANADFRNAVGDRYLVKLATRCKRVVANSGTGIG